MKIFFSISLTAILLYCSAVYSLALQDNNTQTAPTDSSTSAIIKIIPSKFEISLNDTNSIKGKFVTKEVKVYNVGAIPLKILEVSGSCHCASSTVLNSEIAPGEEGKLLLYINLEGLYDENNIVRFEVRSNAKNSPANIEFIFLPVKYENDSPMPIQVK